MKDLCHRRERGQLTRSTPSGMNARARQLARLQGEGLVHGSASNGLTEFPEGDILGVRYKFVIFRAGSLELVSRRGKIVRARAAISCLEMRSPNEPSMAHGFWFRAIQPRRQSSSCHEPPSVRAP